MELWNDFEGKVVDGEFRLGRLVAPKGRSAFFSATGARNEPLTLRLIESLNDEDEILARWGVVRGLSEEHLVRVMGCGRTVLDGTHLVYAAMESTDADLGEVLRERVLTGDETRQMASAVVAGLEALHGAGLVHEHVEAASVLARGEVVKLRSDCVREAPAGAAGETLRRRDAHDFAMLVGYALTGRRDAGTGGGLPRQFEDLVRNGMSGTWGLKEMAALLRPAAPVAGAGKVAAKAPVVVTAPAAEREVLPAAVNGAVPVGAAVGVAGAGRAAAVAGPTLVGSRAGAVAAMSAAAAAPGVMGVGRAGSARSVRPLGGSNSPAAVASGLGGVAAAEGAVPTRRVVADEDWEGAAGMDLRRRAVPLAVAAVLALLVLLIWHYVRRAGPAPVAAVPAAAAPSAAPVAKPSAAAPARVGRTAGRVSAPAAAAAPAAGEVWRVVAFTYAREEPAAAKVAAVKARHPELVPEVYAPKGRSPYLVTVGGWMSAAQAQAMRERARRDGLPRDTYAQNYRGR